MWFSLCDDGFQSLALIKTKQGSWIQTAVVDGCLTSSWLNTRARARLRPVMHTDSMRTVRFMRVVLFPAVKSAAKRHPPPISPHMAGQGLPPKAAGGSHTTAPQESAHAWRYWANLHTRFDLSRVVSGFLTTFYETEKHSVRIV
jgi:hypothetical protein